MTPRFVDASYYIALVSESDQWHESAKHLSTTFVRAMLTTDYVLVEVGNYLSAPRERQSFLQIARLIREDIVTSVIPASPQLLNAGIELFASRLDKSWSLTDCISFVVMEEQGLTEALTFDRHFLQAGFRVPLLA